MRGSKKAIRTVYWEDDAVVLIDQRRLPVALNAPLPLLNCRGYREVIAAIKSLAVRGAPAIGVATALGIALGMRRSSRNRDALHERFERICTAFSRSRPTAINLFWATDRMRRAFASSFADGLSLEAIQHRLWQTAIAIMNDDVTTNVKIGEQGQRLIQDGDNILTHCNAGALACAGYGTALGVLRAAKSAGKRFSVYVDETRPVLQGARLTAWEMRYEGIPATLICDNMAGALMAAGKVNKVITGADRVAANGDTANKIGTYSLAVLANAHGIPFYIAAPLSTFDVSLTTGADIPIEERSAREVTHCGSQRVAPAGVAVFNPAFDVTPASLITAIITERGVIGRPDREKILALCASGGVE